MYELSTLGNILLFTLIATVVSLFLVALLLLHRTFIKRISFFLVSFAAGALLATAFLDTMKEAVEQGGDIVFLWVTVSIAAFYVIERTFLFLHHHEEQEEETNKLRLPTGFLIFGDGMHNFIDGASIAASFLADYRLGIITSLAVFIHEIPHELGDFAVLLQKGWGRRAVLLFNVATGVTAFLGAILAYYFGTTFTNMIPLLLAVTTGNFIYLSTIDLLPEIHHTKKSSHTWIHTGAFLGGILLIALLMHIIPA